MSEKHPKARYGALLAALLNAFAQDAEEGR